MLKRSLKSGRKSTDISKYQIVLSPTFIKETEEIYFHIIKKLQDKKMGQRFLENIKDKIKKIKEFPYIYPKLEYNNRLKKQYRKALVKNYIIVYVINEMNKQINVVHIYNQKTDYLNKI